jgi:hypothetical protein
LQQYSVYQRRVIRTGNRVSAYYADPSNPCSATKTSIFGPKAGIDLTEK